MLFRRHPYLRTGLAAPGLAHRASLLAAVALGLSSAGCPADLEDPQRFDAPSSGTGGATAIDVTTPACVQQVFTASCATRNCHHAQIIDPSIRGGLDLSGPNPAAAMVDVPATYAGIPKYYEQQVGTCPTGTLLVDSNDPLESELLARLDGTQKCGGVMPVAPTRLTTDQDACLRSWIMNPLASSSGSGGGASNDGASNAGAPSTAGQGGSQP